MAVNQISVKAEIQWRICESKVWNIFMQLQHTKEASIILKLC